MFSRNEIKELRIASRKMKKINQSVRINESKLSKESSDHLSKIRNKIFSMIQSCPDSFKSVSYNDISRGAIQASDILTQLGYRVKVNTRHSCIMIYLPNGETNG